MLIHHTCVFKRYIYIVFADRNECETEPSEIYNSLALGLQQISPFLVACMIKIANWSFRLALTFFAPWVFV